MSKITLEDRLLTARQIRDSGLPFSTSFLSRLAQSGEVAVVRAGGVKFVESSFLDWLNRQASFTDVA